MIWILDGLAPENRLKMSRLEWIATIKQPDLDPVWIGARADFAAWPGAREQGERFVHIWGELVERLPARFQLVPGAYNQYLPIRDDADEGRVLAALVAALPVGAKVTEPPKLRLANLASAVADCITIAANKKELRVVRSTDHACERARVTSHETIHTQPGGGRVAFVSADSELHIARSMARDEVLLLSCDDHKKTAIKRAQQRVDAADSDEKTYGELAFSGSELVAAFASFTSAELPGLANLDGNGVALASVTRGKKPISVAVALTIAPGVYTVRGRYEHPNRWCRLTRT